MWLPVVANDYVIMIGHLVTYYVICGLQKR